MTASNIDSDAICLDPSAPLEDIASLENTAPPSASQSTLKYHLLGPSLTKAGQDQVDQQKVSEIIYEASKGSKYFNREEVKDRELTEKIAKIVKRKAELDKVDLASDRRRADECIAELELSRDLSQYVCHIDCDAFYAAVEELDRPELKGLPYGVGKGVLTTCSYAARQFGCRSGMAGFVAKKLCPDLIFLPLNFEKYTAKAQEVRTVLAQYDPDFESASIDEAYLNITDYCKRHDQSPEEVISQLRAEVFAKAKITVSAGIAANAKLAKICSNQNKPNGQFSIPNDRAAIMAFMRDLPCRKVNGVGRVLERLLKGIGVDTCGEIYHHRSSLAKLFGEKTFQFLMTVYLGLGRTSIRPAEDYERKSVGTESTFRDMSDPEELRDKLRHTAEELEKDLRRTQFKGRTLVLKIKLHTYEVLTRQVAPPKAVNQADDLYNYSLPMLTKLQQDIPGMKLRLMGLRVTHLVSTKKEDVDFFGVRKLYGERDRQLSPTKQDLRHVSEEMLPDGWQADDSDALDEGEQHATPRRHGKEILPNPRPANTADWEDEVAPAEEKWPCPICQRLQPANDVKFNEHIDFCLSKQTIQEAVQSSTSGNIEHKLDKPLVASTKNKKRSRSASKPFSNDEAEAKRRMFFA